jgi:uncharacterized protein (TIGR02145 family)
MNYTSGKTISVILFTSLTVFLTTCEKESEAPVVTTNSVSSVTQTTATAGGNITEDWGEQVVQRGVCWNESGNPSINDSKTTDGSGTGHFTSTLTQLVPGKKYYVKAYATNSAGTGYGNEVSFTTDPVKAATLTTEEITLITSRSAVSGGIILQDGGGLITEKGVCWSLDSVPTVSHDKTVDGSGNTSYKSNITGLRPGKKYYVRSYAKNDAGVSYGNKRSFFTPPDYCELTTADVVDLTSTSARSGGNITDDGGSIVKARGVCWSKNPGPTIDDLKTTNGSGNGTFSSDLKNLDPNTVYYVRAYAINDVGESYGNPIKFTTKDGNATLITEVASNIKATSATSGGTISDDGGSAIKVRGICWSLSENPTINDNKITSGSGTGSFSANMTNLLPGKKYYVRAYATNSVTTTYGDQQSFTTRDGNAKLTTANITGILTSSANSGGSISDDGGSPVTARGVCWSTSDNPTINDPKTVDAGGTGSFTSKISSLLPDVTYYVRAYATNAVTTSYAPSRSFKTKDGTAILSTNTVTNIMAASATSGGGITNDGGSPVIVRGICWSTSENPTINDSKTTEGSGTGNFFSNFSGLQPDSKYYVRAYATNDAKTTYGNQQSFTTKDGKPVVTTASVTSVKPTTATCGGNITDDGGSPITARGVCWNTNPDPTTADSKTNDGSGKNNFVSSITNLKPYTTYYVRAYATNAFTTTYGPNQQTFITQVADIDGNGYNTVTINDQVWFKENLKTTKFNDGTSIPYVTDYTEWAALTTPAYCWYNNETVNKDIYGALYTWYTVKTGKLCPAGWHVPSDAELTILENYLGGLEVAGGKLKETGTEHWYSPNTDATNISGFTALPGGWRDGNGGGYVWLSITGCWWSSQVYTTDAPWYRLIYYNSGIVNRPSPGDPSFGLSVRCLKNN